MSGCCVETAKEMEKMSEDILDMETCTLDEDWKEDSVHVQVVWMARTRNQRNQDQRYKVTTSSKK